MKKPCEELRSTTLLMQTLTKNTHSYLIVRQESQCSKRLQAFFPLNAIDTLLLLTGAVALPPTLPPLRVSHNPVSELKSPAVVRLDLLVK